MKKNSFLIFMIMIFNVSSAQVLNLNPEIDKAKIFNKVLHCNKANIIANQQFNGYSKTASVQTRWYNYATTMNNNNGNIGSPNWAYLFPDTLVYAQYGSSYYKTWVHAAAVVLDPTDNAFQYSGSLNINKNMPYRLDSIGIYGKYIRHLNANIVDTLIVEVLAENSLNMPNYYFTGPAVQTNYGTDTLFFKGLYQTNSFLDDNNKTTIKIPLTDIIAADTLASGLNYFKIGLSLPISISAGKVIAMTCYFAPGYTYGVSDTLNNMNYFKLLTFEENGDNTFPSYSKSSFNQSFVVQSAIAGNWSSLFTPTIAFIQAYPFENHAVDFKLSTNQLNPPFRLIISEIMYNDLSNSDSLEYFELFNSSLSPIDLSGYTITKGVNYTFPPNTYLNDGQYLVVAKDSALVNAVFGVSGSLQWDSGALNNSGEEIMIQSPNGDTIAYVDYQNVSPWPVAAGGYGPSIEFCNPVPLYNNDGALWAASNNFVTLFNGDSIFGTPGIGCVVISVENYKEKDDDIRIYPNPANDLVFFNNITSDFEVNIYDIKGILVKQYVINNTKQSISIEQLKSGLYFIQFVDKNTLNKTVKKLIIQ